MPRRTQVDRQETVRREGMSGTFAWRWLGALIGAAMLWWPTALADLTARASLTQIRAAETLQRLALLELRFALAAAAVATLLAVLGGLLPGKATRAESRSRAATLAVAASLGFVGLHAVWMRLEGFRGLAPEARILISTVLGGVPAVVAVAALARLGSPLRRVLPWLLVTAWTIVWPVVHGLSPSQAPVVACGAIGAGLWAWTGAGARWAGTVGLLVAVLGAPSLALLLQPRHDAGLKASPGPGPERPDVVLVVIDTVRFDRARLHVGAMPTLESFSREPVPTTEFSAASSPATSTVPSVKGLLTSQSPSRWGFSIAGNQPPPADAWTLPRAFHEAGFATAFVGANALLRGGGFTRGFERVWVVSGFNVFRGSAMLGRLLAGNNYWQGLRIVDQRRLHKIPAPPILAEAGRWLARPERRPRFLYVHVIEPHWPFYAHGFDLAPPLADGVPPLSHVDLLQLAKGDPRNARFRGSRQLGEMVGRYDEELRAADLFLADLFEELDRRTDRQALVIVTSDHGEEFFDHNGFGHGHDVFQEQAHVPLIIRWPATARYRAMPRVVDTPVSLLDLMPTLIELLDLPSPDRNHAGRSWMPLLDGGASEHVPSVTEAYAGPLFRIGYREGDWKVRLTFLSSVESMEPAAVEVFDLANDPREMQPIRDWTGPVAALVERARLAARARWEAWPDRLLGPADSDLTEEALRQLEALGYL